MHLMLSLSVRSSSSSSKLLLLPRVVKLRIIIMSWRTLD